MTGYRLWMLGWLVVGLAAVAGSADRPVLTGVIEPAELLQCLPDYRVAWEACSPDRSALPVKPDLRDVEIQIVFGSWCGDSLAHLPCFLRIVELLGLTPDRLLLVGVDRDKGDPDGLARAAGVERVPTFIFLRHGEEIGRIVEHPTHSLEEDVSAILAKTD